MPALAAPFNRQAVEDALYAWVFGATGVATNWANQNAAQLARPHMTLAITSTTKLGQDAQILNAEPTAPLSGAEVAIEIGGLRRVVVSVNAYGVSNDPDLDARALMDKALGALEVPSYLAALRVAGVAVARVGAAISLDYLAEDKFISRAQADVTLCVAANLEERVGYIATVDVTNEIVDPAEDYTLDIPTV